jgi:hypothetical protein
MQHTIFFMTTPQVSDDDRFVVDAVGPQIALESFAAGSPDADAAAPGSHTRILQCALTDNAQNRVWVEQIAEI